MLGQHGRKSQHSVMVSGITDLDFNWPPPPANINERAQREWIETTSNLSAADMPRESFSLLAVWCCPKVELDDVMLGLAKFQRVPTRTEELKTHKTLLRMRTALTREFGQLSSKLRLTPSARLDAHRSPSVSNRPWEDASEREDTPQQKQDVRRAPNGNGEPWTASESEQ